MTIRNSIVFPWINILTFILLVNTTSCVGWKERDDKDILPEDKVYTVKGFVIDSENNQPVCNIPLILYQFDEWSQTFRIVKGETQTDDKGFYQIDFGRHEQNSSEKYMILYPYSIRTTDGNFSIDDFGDAESLDLNIYFLKYKQITLFYNIEDIGLPKYTEVLYFGKKANLMIGGNSYKLKEYTNITNDFYNKYIRENLTIPDISIPDATYELFITIFVKAIVR